MAYKKVIDLIDKSLLLLNVLVITLLLLSYLAPIANPQYFSFVAVLGFGYPILVPANILFIPYWLIRSKKVYALIAVLSTLIGISFVFAYCGFHFKSDANIKAKNAIRIMQYNVRALGTYDDTPKPTQKAMYKLFRSKDPDIINIEEFFSVNYYQGDVSDSIRKIMHSKYRYFMPFHKSTLDSSGNAIFSKYPIVNSGTVLQNDPLKTKAIYVDIKKDKNIIRIYCFHLASVQIDDDAKVKYLEGKVPVSKTLTIEKNLTKAFVKRSYQAQQLKAQIDKCPYPFIITGDFNDTPISYAVNTIGRGLKNAFREKGSGLLKTFYSNYPLQIDFIFTSPQFDILNYQAIDNKLSDHKPIISDVVFKN